MEGKTGELAGPTARMTALAYRTLLFVTIVKILSSSGKSSLKPYRISVTDSF